MADGGLYVERLSMNEEQKRQIQDIKKTLTDYEQEFHACKDFIPVLKSNTQRFINLLDPNNHQPNSLNDSITSFLGATTLFEAAIGLAKKFNSQFDNIEETTNLAPQYIQLLASTLRDNTNISKFTTWIQNTKSILSRNPNDINNTNDKNILSKNFLLLLDQNIFTTISSNKYF